MTSQAISPFPEGQVLYCLRDSYGSPMGVPLVGQAGLDLDALYDQYRDEHYADMEAKQEDVPMLSEHSFMLWLTDTGVLSEVEAVFYTADRHRRAPKPYSPAHWPECPSCNGGRGDDLMKNHRHDFNRVEHYFKCTTCAHEWGNADQPINVDRPMLDDDGRYTEGGCTLFATGQVTGLPYAEIKRVFEEHGWTSQEGISSDKGLQAVNALGFQTIPGVIYGRVSLAKLRRRLLHKGKFIVGVRGHWLSIIDGKIIDNAKTHASTSVLDYWEILPTAGANAK
ncbi:hypothetical protein ACYPKM_01080 [Pseudomonas aeruginosa]